MIQSIKLFLGGMNLASKDNISLIKESEKLTVYQLRIFKEKTTRVILFQAQFGKKPNATLSNISTIPNSTNLRYEQVLSHYLDADTVPLNDCLDNNGWVSGDRSNIMIEEMLHRVQQL